MSVQKPILLIEEPAVGADGLRPELEREGFPVDCVTSEAEALDYVRAGREPCLLIIHHDTREQQTADFLYRLRHEEGGDELPVIVIAPPECVAFGATVFLGKPAKPDNLLALVRHYYESGFCAEKAG